MLTFTRLEGTSFVHSAIYLALLYAATLGGKPEPATFVLGLTHGLLWIGMSLVCVAAVRLRVIPLHLAVAVAVLGGFGPFIGSAAFVREARRRRTASSVGDRPGPPEGGVGGPQKPGPASH